MKLTRKQLYYILTNLPDPRLAEEHKIPPFVRVPVTVPNHLIQEALLPNYHKREMTEIIFEYSTREMDWVLKDLEI